MPYRLDPNTGQTVYSDATMTGPNTTPVGQQGFTPASQPGGFFTTNQQTGQPISPSGYPEKLQAQQQLYGFLQNPLQNVGGVIQPLLDALRPSEHSATQNLMDMFRRSGGMQSGAFAQAGRQLQGDILGRRQQEATRAALQFLGPLLGGYQTAFTGLPVTPQSGSKSLLQGQYGQPSLGGVGTSGGNEDLLSMLLAGDQSGMGGAEDYGLSSGFAGGAPEQGYSPLGPSNMQFDPLSNTFYSGMGDTGFSDVPYLQPQQDYFPDLSGFDFSLFQ